MDKLKSYDETEINKKIKKAKFKLLKFLSKIHNIVIHIRNLNNYTNYFKRLAEKIIPIDNRTKWNS
jgi:hypothetical protein